MDGFSKLWLLWQLWPYCHNGHNGHMTIVAIDAIVDRGYPYWCLKKRLDLRIAASKVDYAKRNYQGGKTWKCMRKYFSLINFGNHLYILAQNDLKFGLTSRTARI